MDYGYANGLNGFYLTGTTGEWWLLSVDERKQLMDAARRLRQVGATVVITSRLSGRMVEPLIRMRRLGPSLRIYLVSDTPDRADWQPLIARLQQAEAEVCSVRPVRV